MGWTVVVSRRADRQIEAAERWRKEHRQPSAIRDALRWLGEHVTMNRYMGEAAENARRPGLRRFYLDTIDYFVFWRVDESRCEVTITEIRHARRRPVRM
jgi:plasmid stabilization system protein ParE